YIFTFGNISKNIFYNVLPTYKNVITPYITAFMIGSSKRINHNVIIDFLFQVLNDPDQSKYTFYYNNNDIKFKYEKFIFGVDEYFINKILIKYVIDNKLQYYCYFSFQIYAPIYYSLI